jgi:hypothetical protein
MTPSEHRGELAESALGDRSSRMYLLGPASPYGDLRVCEAAIG